MLLTQPVPLPFQTGLDETSDPRWVQVGAQSSLTNGHLAQSGAVNKRNGFGVYGGSGSYISRSIYGHALAADTYQRLAPFGNGVALINSNRLWGFSPTTKALFDMDAVGPLVAKRYPIDSVLVGSTGGITSYDTAITNGGLVLVAYCAGSILYVCVHDPITKAVVVSVSTGVAADYVRLATITGFANVMMVVQTNATPANLSIYQFDVATFTATPVGSTITDCSAVSVWDIAAWSGTSPPLSFVLAYGSTTGAAHMTLMIVDPNGGVLSTTNITPASTPVTTAIGLRAIYGENIWLAHVDAIAGGNPNKVRVLGRDPSSITSSTSADTELESLASGQPLAARVAVERVDATHALVVWSSLPAGYGMHTKWQQTSTGASPTLGQVRTMQQMGPASTPFTLGGRIYNQLVFSSSGTPPVIVAGGAVTNPAPSAYLVDLLASDSTTVNQSAQLSAIVAPRVVSTNSSTNANLFTPHVPTSGTSAYTLLPVIRSGTDPNGLDLVVYERSRSANQTARLGDGLYLSGGAPTIYDGKRVTELGYAYNVASSQPTIHLSGGAMPDATYTYAFVWEWRDAMGQRKQSQPVFSQAQVISGGSNVASISFTWPDLSLTLCQDAESAWLPSVGLAIYRTIPSVAAGVFVRLWPDSITTATLLGVPYGSNSVTYTDGATDGSIQGNEQLYTSGGVLSSQCPSSLTCLISHQGRLYGVGDDEATIWVSTAWDGGTTQPRFNDALTLTVPDGGRITALASMDGSLIVFKSNQIYIIAGDGPDEAGAGSSWTPPRLVPSEVGCDKDWRSVCVTQFGVIFQHGSRLYMLDRGSSVTYWSRPVADELAAFPVVTSVVVVPNQQQIRVTCRAAEGSSSGRILVYDYVAQAWSVYNTYDSDAAVQGFGTDSACYTSAGSYVWVGGSGSPWFEQASSYLDPGSTWITMSVESAWLKLAGISGYVRATWAHLLMEKQTDADVTISIADDYRDTYAQTETQTAQMLNDGTFTAKPQTKVHIVRQKSSAIRVKISDATPTNGTVGTGQGYSWIGLTIMAGVKKGLRKLPQTQGA